MRTIHPRRSAGSVTFGALVASVLGVVACTSRDAETPAATREGPTPAASAEATPPSTMTPPPMPHRGGDMPAEACPMAVPGTSAAVSEIEGGAAIDLTTTGDVAAVRARARTLAEHHAMRMEERPSRAGEGKGPPMGPGPGPTPGPRMGGRMQGMADVQVRVEDVEGGARLVLTPRSGNDSDVARVRAHAQQMATRMASGHCPQMMM